MKWDTEIIAKIYGYRACGGRRGRSWPKLDELTIRGGEPASIYFINYQDVGFRIVVPGMGSGNCEDFRTPFRIFL